MKKIFATLLLLLAFVPVTFAQDEEKEESNPEPIPELFYGTRTVNFHTVRQLGRNVLAYRISHRFGSLREDQLYTFLGLDGPASISFMFDYGITDNLMIGVARDQFQKVYNGYIKYNLLNQESGGGSPVTLAVYGKGNIISLRNPAPPGGFNRFEDFANRMSYIAQVLVARRFGERFALQLAPTYVHHNLVEFAEDANDMFALTGSAQFMLTKRMGLSGEFGAVVNEYSITPENFHPTGSIGLDIVTGGHVFQIMVTNSPIINEAFSIPYTQADIMNGDVRLGFNISRKFWL
ncbi:MAG: DUF5777 family beta-barrel protein [Bacteroidota bacterium]